MTEILEDLIEIGYTRRGRFADLHIYGKDEDRILYDPGVNKIVLSYKSKKDKETFEKTNV